MEDSLKIDAAFGEGGGSILRLSVAFSVLFQKPIQLFNIRAKRSKPGLRLQHLLGIKTLAKLTNSKLSKCGVGTTELTFIPGINSSINNYLEVEIDTAASLGLLIQPIQIASLGFHEPEKIEILLKGGGTFGKWAPSISYLANVTNELFKRSGLRTEIEVERHGFYPKGGALVKVKIFPPQGDLKPLTLTELGETEVIKGEIICSTHLRKPQVAQRIKESATKYLSKKVKNKMEIIFDYVPSFSTGVGLTLWSQTSTGAIISSGTILGEKGLSSEEIGKIAVNELLKYIHHNIPVDNYLSDQLIPLMAYVRESSCIKVLEITSHAKTNMDLLKLFLPRESIIVREDEGYLINYPKI